MDTELDTFFLRLRRILWEDNFDIVEVLGCINLLGWGAWLIFHQHLFAINNVYETMAYLAQEYVWGTAFILIGGLKIYSFWIDRYRTRRLMAGVATLFWIFIGVAFLQGNSQSLLVFVAFEISVFSAWEYFRHSRKAKLREIIRNEINKELSN